MRSTSWDQRARPALLLHRWGNWWRILWAWRGMPGGQRFLALCAYCGRVRLPGGGWEEIPPAVSRRFHLNSGPQVTHGVCPDCFAKVDQPPST